MKSGVGSQGAGGGQGAGAGGAGEEGGRGRGEAVVGGQAGLSEKAVTAPLLLPARPRGQGGAELQGRRGVAVETQGGQGQGREVQQGGGEAGAHLQVAGGGWREKMGHRQQEDKELAKERIGSRMRTTTKTGTRNNMT